MLSHSNHIEYSFFSSTVNILKAGKYDYYTSQGVKR